jgi:DNA-binding response OmpR family regulator
LTIRRRVVDFAVSHLGVHNLGNRIGKTPRNAEAMAHILVVEDDADTREYLVQLLASAGHESTTCSSAEEAEAVCYCRLPDLALLDIHLPRKHGVSLAWHLRRQAATLPIVIFSAVLDQWDQDDLWDCGANAILPKPCSADEVLRTLHQLLPPTASRDDGLPRQPQPTAPTPVLTNMPTN